MSSYFKDFPQYLYDFNYGNGKSKTSAVVDITRNIRIKQHILSNVALYDEYDIVDGETPEIIAEKYYGTADYHWVVMLANDKFDYRNDFPLIEPILQKHIIDTYNRDMHVAAGNWSFQVVTVNGVVKQRLVNKFPYDNFLPLDPDYLIAPVKVTITGKTTTVNWKLVNNWPINHGSQGVDPLNQTFYQDLPDATGVITCNKANAIVQGVNTNFESLFVGCTIYNDLGELLGTVKSIESNNLMTLTDKSTEHVDGKSWYWRMTGTPVGEMTIKTEGRENNPVYFVNTLGHRVNPSPTAIPVTGAAIHRNENDKKRKIKIISPSLLEVLIRNYEEEL